MERLLTEGIEAWTVEYVIVDPEGSRAEPSGEVEVLESSFHPETGRLVTYIKRDERGK